MKLQNNNLKSEGERVKTEFEKIILTTVQEGINEAIKKRLIDDYNSPIKPLIDDVIKGHLESLRSILNVSLSETIKSCEFKESMAQAFRHKLARGCIDSLAGSLEKAINALKSDPTIKAKMVLAIEKVIEESNQKIK